MKAQIFIQVSIEGKEENLPKQGTYFINAKGFLTSWLYSNLIPDCKEKWLKEVDWYLQPQPASLPKKTKNKIDKDKCAHHFVMKREIFRCDKCGQTMGKWIQSERNKVNGSNL